MKRGVRFFFLHGWCVDAAFGGMAHTAIMDNFRRWGACAFSLSRLVPSTAGMEWEREGI